MMYRCEVCGKYYEHSGLGRKPKTCSPECAHERNITRQREYWMIYKDKINSERVQKKIKKKLPKENSLAEINELAREQNLTYGQMQGVFYCQEHPIR